MTPEPGVLAPDPASVPAGSPTSDGADPAQRPATMADRAAEIAFGGESSNPTAEPGDNGSLVLLLGFVGVILAIGFLRSWWFPGILAGLLFMLFMHELGHYLTARASGMKVTEFFLGFGPKIWSFNKGETEYGVKAIPAGAYVRIIGMTNLDDINPAEEHRTYRAQPYWQRMMTICAGSAMHFLMATVALVVLFASYSYPGFNGPGWSVSQVVPGSTAASLGIQEGDRIESINGETFDNWDEFGDVVGGLDEGPVEVVIDRQGDEVALNGTLGLRPEDILLDGFGLNLQSEIPGLGVGAAFVWPEDPADDFGIEQGDLLLSVAGIDEPTEATIAPALRAADGGDPIVIEVLRGGDVVSLIGTVADTTSPDAVDDFLDTIGFEEGDRLLTVGEITGPTEADIAAALEASVGEVLRIQVLRGGDVIALENTVELNSSTPFRGFFGVGRTFDDPRDRGIGESIPAAVDDFATIAVTNLVGIFDLIDFTNWGGDDDGVVRRSAQIAEQRAPAVEITADEECGGPDTNRPLSVVGIGRLISCSESADQVIFLFAVVNIFIGIFNLFPLLPLDGGHALIATYERARELITRRPHRVDAAKLVPITWVVIFLLAGLGLWTATLDIFSW